MAQLSDDCFAHGGSLMGVDEALGLLERRVGCIAASETAPLAAALDRILAEDLTAARNVPPYDNSAVDGYAISFDDLDPGRETRLKIAGRAAAGHPLGSRARAGRSGAHLHRCRHAGGGGHGDDAGGLPDERAMRSSSRPASSAAPTGARRART